MTTIKFYTIKMNYKEFLTTYPCNFTIDGVDYQSSENYYQSEKFKHIDWFSNVLKDCSPKQSRAISNLRPFRDGTDDEKIEISEFRKRLRNEGYVLSRLHDSEYIKEFEKNKLDIMYLAIKAKFAQNKNLKNLLLETQDKKLVYSAPTDSFWGIGKDRKGDNNMGKLLMRLREELSEDDYEMDFGKILISLFALIFVFTSIYLIAILN